jgi:hypothetical protein
VAESDELRVGFAVDDVTGVIELPDQTEASESPVLLGAVLADSALIGIIDVARAIERAAAPAAEPDLMRAVRS